MTLINNLIDNNYIIYSLYTTTACFIGYLVIKSYFYSTIIETPNSPPTFNLTGEQMDTLNKIIEKWEELENVNEDIQNIIGEEVFERMEHKFQNLENEIEDRFEDLEDELLDTFRYPFEDLINSPFEEFSLFYDLTNYQFKYFILGVILFSWITYKKSRNINLFSLKKTDKYTTDKNISHTYSKIFSSSLTSEKTDILRKTRNYLHEILLLYTLLLFQKILNYPGKELNIIILTFYTMLWEGVI
jgi:hypothetical protein